MLVIFLLGYLDHVPSLIDRNVCSASIGRPLTCVIRCKALPRFSDEMPVGIPVIKTAYVSSTSRLFLAAKSSSCDMRIISSLRSIICFLYSTSIGVIVSRRLARRLDNSSFATSGTPSDGSHVTPIHLFASSTPMSSPSSPPSASPPPVGLSLLSPSASRSSRPMLFPPSKMFCLSHPSMAWKALVSGSRSTFA